MEVLWSPSQADKFLTFGTELSLYDVTSTNQSGVKLSEDLYASVLSVNSDHQYMKCVAWYPRASPENLVAVGLASGRVVLTSFRKGGADPNNLIGKEFMPKHHRQCNYLAWNPVDSNLLAEGLEKSRSDYSIYIWDINSKSSVVEDRRYSTAQVESATVVSKPLLELGPSEATLSLAWFRSCTNTLVTGINNKFLRIFDLRDTTRPQSVAYTKAVYGVKVDPHGDHRLASYFEGQVAVWDTRSFDKPVLTLPPLDNKHVVRVAWSPTRHNLLGCLTRDGMLKLWDIQHTTIGPDELEPAWIERTLPWRQQNLSSFDWHPTQENQMLTTTSSGTLTQLQIHERIAVSWSPDINLTWASGRQLRQCNTVAVCREANEDICIKMKRRALKSYGLQKEVSLNADPSFVGDDATLRNMWLWINFMRENSVDTQNSSPGTPVTPGTPTPPPTPQRPPSRHYPGVKAILLSPTNSNTGPRSELDFWHWQGVDNLKFRAQRKVFRSDTRLRALNMCGWGYEKEAPTLHVLEKLLTEHEYERAATIAVLTLRMTRAIQILNKGAASPHQKGDVSLTVVAMALSGYTEEKQTLWREMCGSLSAQLTHPYLRAMFSFLTADTDDYQALLEETSLEVVDRVAFACMYLSDAKLHEFIDSLTNTMIQQGCLDGLLLTGFCEDGVRLFESYVDRTGDVQTAALAMLQALPSDTLARDLRVLTWLEGYRTLLDTLRLWHQRAEFDVARQGCDTSTRPQNQVYLSCIYCGRSVSTGLLAGARNRHFMYGGAPAHKTKVSSCPNCRKPLPRCALCLINMGTASGSASKVNQPMREEEEPEKLSEFSHWFTWCQTCRHGGHSDHMTQWFSDHSECPVTGCTCKCASLDTGHAAPPPHT